MKWVQQQHVKRRRKRDYVDDFEIPNFFEESQHRARYSGSFGSQGIFPDPLFKEQWYLVS